MSRQRSLEQERAKAAWDKVVSVRDHGRNQKGESYAKEYGSLARSAPVDIQANGLGQMLAFWRAKGYTQGRPKDGDNEHARLYQDVSAWVVGQLRELGVGFPDDMPDLLEWVIKKAQPDEYRWATMEAIAFLIWIKRFAEAELPREGE